MKLEIEPFASIMSVNFRRSTDFVVSLRSMRDLPFVQGRCFAWSTSCFAWSTEENEWIPVWYDTSEPLHNRIKRLTGNSWLKGDHRWDDFLIGFIELPEIVVNENTQTL